MKVIKDEWMINKNRTTSPLICHCVIWWSSPIGVNSGPLEFHSGPIITHNSLAHWYMYQLEFVLEHDDGMERNLV
jgi:hypothetical protein